MKGAPQLTNLTVECLGQSLHRLALHINSALASGFRKNTVAILACSAGIPRVRELGKVRLPA